MAYDVGQKVRTRLSIVDEDGNPADTNLAVEVIRGDLTEYPTPTVVHDDLGEYYFDVVVDSAGLWTWAAAATTPIVAAETGQWFVRTGAPAILSMKEVKRYLNKDLNVTVDDEEIRDLADTVTTIVEDIVGPVIPRAVTETFDGGGSVLYLKGGHVRAVTAVREAWGVGDVRTLTAYVPGVNEPADGFYFDREGGRVYRTTGGSRTRFYGGLGGVNVDLVRGRETIPPNFRTAAGSMISHVWRQDQYARGVTRPRADSTDTTIVMGYAIPNRVLELLGRQKRAPRLGIRSN